MQIFMDSGHSCLHPCPDEENNSDLYSMRIRVTLCLAQEHNSKVEYFYHIISLNRK